MEAMPRTGLSVTRLYLETVHSGRSTIFIHAESKSFYFILRSALRLLIVHSEYGNRIPRNTFRLTLLNEADITSQMDQSVIMLDNSSTAWSRVLLWKLIVAQGVRKYLVLMDPDSLPRSKQPAAGTHPDLDLDESTLCSDISSSVTVLPSSTVDSCLW